MYNFIYTTKYEKYTRAKRDREWSGKNNYKILSKTIFLNYEWTTCPDFKKTGLSNDLFRNAIQNTLFPETKHERRGFGMFSVKIVPPVS